MKKRLTAGELALKAAGNSAEKVMDVAVELTRDVGEQLQECINKHKDILVDDEFCVVMIVAYDSLLKNVLRRKFYAWPFMPKPRPHQSVFLYNRRNDSIKRLWCLPEAFCMASLSSMQSVAPQWQTMKNWSDAFFAGKFYQLIRSESKIDLLSEEEYLEANREKLAKAMGNQVAPTPSEAFDFSKIQIDHIVDTKTARTE